VVSFGLLTDEKATRLEILKGLGWLRKQMTQRDVGIVMFAGHGAKDSDGSFYLMPVDVDPENLLATGVPSAQLKTALAAAPGKVIFMLDACHSAAVGGDRRRAATSLTDDLIRDLVSDDYGIVVMCAAGSREFALESEELGHGYFTFAIVEALRGAGDYTKDGKIELLELELHVNNRVKELAGGNQHASTEKPPSITSFDIALIPAAK
jgi:uncharacterized caspase-like protein